MFYSSHGSLKFLCGRSAPFAARSSLSVVDKESPLCTVYRLTYNGDVAAGQLAVFQGASEAPISGFIRVERATRKNRPTGRGPEGCVENGPAAALLVGYVSDLDMRPPRALPAAHFERNDITIICETVHYWASFPENSCSRGICPVTNYLIS